MSNVAHGVPTGSRGSASRGQVRSGLRGVASGKGNVQNFPRLSVRRTIPGRRLGVNGPTFDNLNGGAPARGFIGRLRSGATTSV